MTKITLEGGVQIRTYRPPPAFDPLSASAADLIRYGFPQRPTDPVHLERYQRVFGQLKHKFQYIEPTFRINAERVHGPRRRLPEAGTETSTNWSGGVVFAPMGQSFKWIEGDWVVPDVDAPTENQWFYCSNWIGIDGDGSADVCQIGVECEAFRSARSTSRNIYPWWEWFPLPEVQITNFPVSPGDMVTMLLCTTGANATTASAFLTNRTTGASTSFSFDAPNGTKLVGNCAEWIVEAPTVNGAQSAIADYGEVFFSVCEACLTNNTTIDGGTGNNINLTASGQTVSDGNLITSTIIQCLYVGTQPPQLVAVPDVFELSVPAATNSVHAAGLVSKFTGANHTNSWVFSQSPLAGDRVAPGSTVSMVLHDGPRP
jgi:Peptidase A4 family/PASTA domain